LIFANLFFVTRDLHYAVDENICRTKPTEVIKASADLGNWRVHSVYGPVQQWLYASRDEGLIKWAAGAGVGDSWLPWHVNQSWQSGQKLERYFALYYLLWSLPLEQAGKLSDLLSIRYSLSGSPFDQICWHGADRRLQLVEHPNARPRAFLVDNLIVADRVDDPKRATAQIVERLLAPDFDLTSTAIVEVPNAGADDQSIPPPPEHERDIGEIVSFQDKINEVRVHVIAKTNALLVLNDAWYPGWSSFIDGHREPIFRTNFHFRGVFVQQGEHDLRFVFAPPLFRIGLWIAASTVLLVGIFLCWLNYITKKPASKRSATVS
jgi:hypothetical protein